MEHFDDFINMEQLLFSFPHTWATPLAEQGPGGGLIEGFRQILTSWRGGEGNRDGGSFRGSVWICAVSLDYRQIQCCPIPFYFFPPLLEVVMTILNTVSMEKGWARATLLLFTDVTLWSKKSILTPYLSGRIKEFLSFMVFVLQHECSTTHERPAVI